MSIKKDDTVRKVAIVAAMRNVVDLESDGPKSNEEVYALFGEMCDIADKGIDPFAGKEIHVWNIIDQESSDQESYNEVLMEITSQADVIERAMRGLLKTTHEGLIEMAINDELDSDANGWDLAHAANLGAELAAKDDALASDASYKTQSEPSL